MMYSRLLSYFTFSSQPIIRMKKLMSTTTIMTTMTTLTITAATITMMTLQMNLKRALKKKMWIQRQIQRMMMKMMNKMWMMTHLTLSLKKQSLQNPSRSAKVGHGFLFIELHPNPTHLRMKHEPDPCCAICFEFSF